MKYSLNDLTNKLSTDIGYVDLPHDEHMVTIWQKNKDTFLFGNTTNKYFLEFNGKFIKSGKTLKPIITKLKNLGLKVE